MERVYRVTKNRVTQLGPKLADLATKEQIEQNIKFLCEQADRSEHFEYERDRAKVLEKAARNMRRIFVFASDAGMYNLYLAIENEYIVWDDEQYCVTVCETEEEAKKFLDL